MNATIAESGRKCAEYRAGINTKITEPGTKSKLSSQE